MLLVWLGSYPQWWGVHRDERTGAEALAQRDDEDMLIIALLEEDMLLREDLWPMIAA